jgi:primosomal protein N' (replication factor Y)
VRCHHCQSEQRLPRECPQCGRGITVFGLGVQRVEEELSRLHPALVPGSTMLRIDADSMQDAEDFHDALGRFGRGEVRLLVGTQMIAKGLDFPGVRLVGVVNADTALNLPDFRAAERTFQLLSQVAGRAGRGDKPGRVVVQTYQPQHPAVLAAQRHDHLGFVTHELAERSELGYPPHGRLAAVRIDAEDRAEAEQAANLLAEVARSTPEVESARVEVLGPAPAPIERVRSRYRQRLLVRGADRRHVRAVARAVLERIEAGLGKARASVDVDPVSML